MIKIAIFDIETWDLAADFGPLLCASVLSQEPGRKDKMITLRQDALLREGAAEDMTDDRELCLALRDLLEEHDLSVGYFSKGFDIPHLRTRLVLHGERPLKEMLHYDPIWFVKGWRGLKPMSAKMKHVTKFFGFEEKPEVAPEVWLKARGGNRKAMDEVCGRCQDDVRITAKIAQEILRLGLPKTLQRY